MKVDIGLWDVALAVVVSLQATGVAYVREPKWKAALLTLPFPFTIATLAVGRPVGLANVLGLVLLLVFTHGVRLLHKKLRLPIVLAIVVAALGYVGLGAVVAPILPDTDPTFWLALAGVLILGISLFLVQRPQSEPGHKSPLPVWLKLPIIMGVVAFLVAAKSTLQGFVTMFPMVGVVAVYEARYSLWTIARQIPVLMITIGPMMAVCRLTQDRVGMGGALALGWLAFLAILLPLTWWQWSKDEDLLREAQAD